MEDFLNIGFMIQDENERKIKLSYDWTEIKKYQHLNNPINIGVFKLIRALELNQLFVSKVLGIRKKYSIPPSGYSIDKYDSLDILNDKIPDARGEFRKLYKYINTEENIDLIFDEFIELNFVNPDYERISINFKSGGSTEFYGYGVIIEIFNRISKNEFLKKIEKEWPNIEKELKKIKTRNPFEIAFRDIKIVRLRDISKYKFKEISDIIQKDIPEDDIDNIVNEDLIKTAYHRSKKKINDLFKLKK